jgi:hypothetical protein
MRPAGDGARLPIPSTDVLLGNSADAAQVVLAGDIYAEPKHAQLFRDAFNRWKLEALETRNGLWLLPLPAERFVCFQEGKRKVNRDGHVEVAKAYYSAPPEYLGREVWVRWDARLVRLFNHRFEQIAMHMRHEQGRFSTHNQHIAKEKISGLERGAAYLLNQVSVVGPFTQQWSEAVVNVHVVAWFSNHPRPYGCLT